MGPAGGTAQTASEQPRRARPDSTPCGQFACARADGRAIAPQRFNGIAECCRARAGQRPLEQAREQRAHRVAAAVDLLEAIGRLAHHLDHAAEADGHVIVGQQADRIVALVNRMEVFTDRPPCDRGPVNIHGVLETVRQLAAAGVDVLLDDRGERPGAMFADWELIGVPHRVTIGDKGLKDGLVEYQHRRDTEASKVAVGEVLGLLKAKMSA